MSRRKPLRIPGTLSFDVGELHGGTAIVDAMQRISVSGVQEKFPAIMENGELKLATADVQSTYILKPVPWDRGLQNRKQLPVNEHLTMQIAARQYGIETAGNALCKSRDGIWVYVTKRFDIDADGRKLPMEDFASIIGRDGSSKGFAYKYTGSYHDIANAIRKHASAWMVEMEKFFNMVVFNYIFANADAHLKNFSLLFLDGVWQLAPAYDLLNTALHIDGGDFGLDGGLSPVLESSDTYDRTGHPCREDFYKFGLLIGLRPVRINRILDRYNEIPDTVRQMIADCDLDEKMKRSYLRVISERTARFNRPPS